MSVLWTVHMPCARCNPKTGNESYVMLVYYVQAETKEEASIKAETYLPKFYDLDDSAIATPFKPGD